MGLISGEFVVTQITLCRTEVHRIARLSGIKHRTKLFLGLLGDGPFPVARK